MGVLRRLETKAIIADPGGVDRVIVRRGAVWFYDDDEVPPDTPGAKEYDGHWYPIGHGVAMPE